jgi:hypothetical protein
VKLAQQMKVPAFADGLFLSWLMFDETDISFSSYPHKILFTQLPFLPSTNSPISLRLDCFP